MLTRAPPVGLRGACKANRLFIYDMCYLPILHIFALSLFSCVHAFAPYLFCCWLSKANTMGAPSKATGARVGYSARKVCPLSCHKDLSLGQGLPSSPRRHPVEQGGPLAGQGAPGRPWNSLSGQEALFQARWVRR